MSCALAIGSTDNFVTLLGTGSSFVSVVRTFVTASIFDVFAEVSISTVFNNKTGNSINPTYTLPLLEHVILYDVEILVDGEKRAIVDSNDVDEVRHLLERRVVVAGKQVFYVQVGEILPGKEVTVKCTYATGLAIEGGAIQFTLPANVTPNKVGDEDISPLNMSLSLEAHDNIIDVTSSHPSYTTSSTIAENSANIEVSVASGFLASDLKLLFRVQDITVPRAWTCVGTSGGLLTTRSSVLVLQPPISQVASDDSNNEGEIGFVFFDINKTRY